MPLPKEKPMSFYIGWCVLLAAAKFPIEFSAEDLYFVGRPIQGQKVVLQIVQRKNDSRFTAEVMGVIQ
jgi:hypothetical protein